MRLRLLYRRNYFMEYDVKIVMINNQQQLQQAAVLVYNQSKRQESNIATMQNNFQRIYKTFCKKEPTDHEFCVILFQYSAPTNIKQALWRSQILDQIRSIFRFQRNNERIICDQFVFHNKEKFLEYYIALVPIDDNGNNSLEPFFKGNNVKEYFAQRYVSLLDSVLKSNFTQSPQHSSERSNIKQKDSNQLKHKPQKGMQRIKNNVKENLDEASPIPETHQSVNDRKSKKEQALASSLCPELEASTINSENVGTASQVETLAMHADLDANNKALSHSPQQHTSDEGTKEEQLPQRKTSPEYDELMEKYTTLQTKYNTTHADLLLTRAKLLELQNVSKTYGSIKELNQKLYKAFLFNCAIKSAQESHDMQAVREILHYLTVGQEYCEKHNIQCSEEAIIQL